jgi:hypothetical protein
MCPEKHFLFSLWIVTLSWQILLGGTNPKNDQFPPLILIGNPHFDITYKCSPFLV